MLNTWRDAYFLFCKSTIKYWILLFIVFCLFEVLGGKLIPFHFSPSVSHSNSKVVYYLFCTFLIISFLGKVYFKSLFFCKMYYVSKNIDHSIKDIMSFVNNRFFIIVSCCFLVSIFFRIKETDFVLLRLAIYFRLNPYLNHFISDAIAQVFNAFIYVPVLILIPSLLFADNKWVCLLKGNWIKSVIVLMLPIIISRMIFVDHHETRFLLDSLIYAFSAPVALIHFNNLKENYLHKVL
jgi:hypothetical protein